MGQAETKIFENAPAWHENDVLATTDFEEEVLCKFLSFFGCNSWLGLEMATIGLVLTIIRH